MTMTQISIDDVKKLARLSALSITDEQAILLNNELTKIIGFVEQLNAVNTDGVVPTYQVTDLETVTRKDEIIDYEVSQRALLQNAPHTQEGQIKVPRVL